MLFVLRILLKETEVRYWTRRFKSQPQFLSLYASGLCHQGTHFHILRPSVYFTLDKDVLPDGSIYTRALYVTVFSSYSDTTTYEQMTHYQQQTERNVFKCYATLSATDYGAGFVKRRVELPPA